MEATTARKSPKVTIRKVNGLHALWLNGRYHGSFRTRTAAMRWAERYR